MDFFCLKRLILAGTRLSPNSSSSAVRHSQCKYELQHKNYPHILPHTHTRTHTQSFNSLWSGTTWVGRYQKKHSPAHTHPDHWTSFYYITASSLLSLCARHSCLTVLTAIIECTTIINRVARQGRRNVDK